MSEIQKHFHTSHETFPSAHLWADSDVDDAEAGEYSLLRADSATDTTKAVGQTLLRALRADSGSYTKVEMID